MRKNYYNENRNDRDNNIIRRPALPRESYNVNVTGAFDGKCNIEGNIDVKININVDLDGASIAEILNAMTVANKASQAEENIKGFLEDALDREMSAINNGFNRLVESINNKFNHKSEDK